MTDTVKIIEARIKADQEALAKAKVEQRPNDLARMKSNVVAINSLIAENLDLARRQNQAFMLTLDSYTKVTYSGYGTWSGTGDLDKPTDNGWSSSSMDC